MVSLVAELKFLQICIIKKQTLQTLTIISHMTMLIQNLTHQKIVLYTKIVIELSILANT